MRGQLCAHGRREQEADKDQLCIWYEDCRRVKGYM